MKRDELLALAIFCGLAALALTAWVGLHGTPLPGDLWVAHRVQASTALSRNASIINGAAPAIWAVVPVAIVAILARRRLGIHAASLPSRREALSAVALAIVLALGSNLLKLILRSPRPAAGPIHVAASFSGYGFPSGHVYGDTLFYGLLAVIAPAWLPRLLVLPARIVALAIILLAGPARVVVGAHWPSDTLGGYLWGAPALCLALWFGRWVAAR